MVLTGPAISEEMFENVDDTDDKDADDTDADDGPAYTISSLGTFGSGELKKKKKRSDDIYYNLHGANNGLTTL